MSEHTPTPWAFETQTSFSHIVHGPGSESVCDVIDVRNAAFIVRACNNFDELVEALEGVIRVADRATVEFDAARAAVAKARGRTP